MSVVIAETTAKGRAARNFKTRTSSGRSCYVNCCRIFFRDRIDSGLVGRDVTKLPPKAAKFTECLNDHVDIRAGGFPQTAREMAHFDLVYAHAKLCRLGKNFGVNHCAHAPDLHVLENFTSE